MNWEAPLLLRLVWGGDDGTAGILTQPAIIAQLAKIYRPTRMDVQHTGQLVVIPPNRVGVVLPNGGVASIAIESALHVSENTSKANFGKLFNVTGPGSFAIPVYTEDLKYFWS